MSKSVLVVVLVAIVAAFSMSACGTPQQTLNSLVAPEVQGQAKDAAAKSGTDANVMRCYNAALAATPQPAVEVDRNTNTASFVWVPVFGQGYAECAQSRPWSGFAPLYAEHKIVVKN